MGFLTFCRLINQKKDGFLLVYAIYVQLKEQDMYSKHVVVICSQVQKFSLNSSLIPTYVFQFCKTLLWYKKTRVRKQNTRTKQCSLYILCSILSASWLEGYGKHLQNLNLEDNVSSQIGKFMFKTTASFTLHSDISKARSLL